MYPSLVVYLILPSLANSRRTLGSLPHYRLLRGDRRDDAEARGNEEVGRGVNFLALFSFHKIFEQKDAGNRTEVIRQVVLAYERMIEEEELTLVHKAVETEMKELEAGKIKTYSFEEIKELHAMRFV
jgi:hypothetical protein